MFSTIPSGEKVLEPKGAVLDSPVDDDDLPAAKADRNHRYSRLSPAEFRAPVSASFQLDVDDAAQIVCPACNRPAGSTGVMLNLKIGPVVNGSQVLFIRPGASMKSVVDDVRRALMRDALARANGVQSRAAKLLGMKYTTFHTLARRLGLGKAPKGQRESAGATE